MSDDAVELFKKMNEKEDAEIQRMLAVFRTANKSDQVRLLSGLKAILREEIAQRLEMIEGFEEIEKQVAGRPQ